MGRRARVLALWSAGLAALTLPGCGAARMMPTPLAVREVGIWPARVGEDGRTVEVYYATTRGLWDESAAGVRYKSEPSGALRLGSAGVRLGDMDRESLGRGVVAGARASSRVVRVEEFGGVEAGAEVQRSLLREALRARAGPGGDVIVYVPGFNSSFRENVRLVAEFSYFLGPDTPLVLYSWPAHSHPFAYTMDRRRARESVAGFREFLRFLAEDAGAGRVHVLTSSAGAPVVSGALEAIRAEYADTDPAAVRERTRIGEVVYAASDQGEREFFEVLESGAAAMAEHITVYASRDDLGLVLTRHLGSGDITIGRLPAHLNAGEEARLLEHAARVTVVDATRASRFAGRGGIWAHSYWHLNPWVSSDLLGVLRHRLEPSRRGLAAAREGAIWEFPADYPERLGEVLVGCGLLWEGELAK